LSGGIKFEPSYVGAYELIASIEVRAAHEVMAARATEFAFLVVKFMAAARAPSPIFARNVTLDESAVWSGGFV
jgi:hypothetical protein